MSAEELFKRKVNTYKEIGNSYEKRIETLEATKEKLLTLEEKLSQDMENKKMVFNKGSVKGIRGKVSKERQIAIGMAESAAEALGQTAAIRGNKLDDPSIIDSMNRIQYVSGELVNLAIIKISRDRQLTVQERISIQKKIDSKKKELTFLQKEIRSEIKEFEKEATVVSLLKRDVKKGFKTLKKNTQKEYSKIKRTLRNKFESFKEKGLFNTDLFLWLAEHSGALLMISPLVKPALVAGMIPLSSVQYMERARSNRVLKIRAVGGVFLAHQEGGNDVLVVKGTLAGPLRYVWLYAMEALQSRGENQPVSGEFKELFEKLETMGVGLSKGTIESLAEISKNPSETTKVSTREIHSFEYHKTFPIITQIDILLNMFLQTFHFKYAVENGQRIVTYTAIFRKYLKPSKFFAGKVSKKTKTVKMRQFSGETAFFKIKEEFIDGLWKTWQSISETIEIGRRQNPFTEYINPIIPNVADLTMGFQMEALLG